VTPTDEYWREQRLYEILLEYLEAAERGKAINPAELLADHPEFAAELQEFMEMRDWLECLVAPLWAAGRHDWRRRPMS
jgi:hypothetical protein